MATYKVIQDIEAEDKLVGPLSLRQFIYAAIAALCGYLSFIAITKGAAFMLVVFAPVMLFTGFFAAPWGRNQPTEVWALAKIRFFIKPRRRIWNQSGVKDLVTITAPKLINKIYTNGLSQTEVQSRLTALASTLDTRGWAIKNVNANLYDPERTTVLPESDRLISLSTLPQEVPTVDILASDDILDETSNPTAQKLEQLVNQSTNTHRQQIMSQLNQLSTPSIPNSNSQLPPPADYWFLRKPIDVSKRSGSTTASTDTHLIMPGTNDESLASNAAEPTVAEEELVEKLKYNRQKMQAMNVQHMKVIQPLGQQTSQVNNIPASVSNVTTSQVTPASDPAKMSLARRDDLSITAIGHIANKQDEQPDEVVITLHDHAS